MLSTLLIPGEKKQYAHLQYSQEGGYRELQDGQPRLISSCSYRVKPHLIYFQALEDKKVVTCCMRRQWEKGVCLPWRNEDFVITAYRYLWGGHQKDTQRLFTVVHDVRVNSQKLKQRKSGYQKKKYKHLLQGQLSTGTGGRRG